MLTYIKANSIFVLAAFALLTLSAAAHAQTTYISVNTTLDASNPITGNVYGVNAAIGYANANDYFNGTNPTSPTVRLVNGGLVSGGLDAYNSSLVNISGGSVAKTVAAYNNSTVNISGGNVGNGLFALDGGSINLSGGNIGNGLQVQGGGTINLFGTGRSLPS